MNPLVIQNEVPRFMSIRNHLSGLKWQSGVSTFFTENVPFSYSTSTWFASKIVEIAQTYKGNWLELGSGLGILSRHILDNLQKNQPHLYKEITLNLSDYAPALVNKMVSSGLFSDHPNTHFHVIDAHNPKIEEIAPSVIIISYLLDSLNCRHIEVENGTIYELTIKTTLPESAHVFDTTKLPPELIDAETIRTLLIGNDTERQKRLSPFICKIIEEEYIKTPLEQTTMSEEEKLDLRQFVKTIPEKHVLFNYSFEFSQIFTKLIEKSAPESVIIIQDYGYRTFSTHLNPTILTTAYRTIICHAIYFPYIDYVAKKNGVHFNISSYTPGDTQLAVIYKGQNPKKNKEICNQVFKTKGYEEIQKVYSAIYDITGSKEENISQLLSLWSTLTKFEKEDYLVVIAFASRCYEEGYFEKAIQFIEKISEAYQAISIPAYYLLGKCYKELGQIENAKKSFLTCSDISFEYPSAYNELSFLYLKEKKYTDYLEFSQRFISLSGEAIIWEHFVTQILVYLEIGQAKNAKKLLDWIESSSQIDSTLIPNKILVKLNSIRHLI